MMEGKTPKIRFRGFNENWKEIKLGEASVFHDGKRVPLSADDRASRQGQFAYYGASGVIDYVDDFIFDGEFVLLGEDGANILSRSQPLAFIAKGKFWVNNHAHVLSAKGNNKFLAEALERINFAPYNTGTVQPKLNAEVCKKIPINLPCKEEQQKIASFLSAVDERIELLERKKEKLEAYKKGVMQQLFSQQIRFKQDDGSEFPDWEEKKSKDVYMNISNKKHNGDLPILSASQERGMVLREENGIKIQASEKSVTSYKIVEPDDFVISLRSFQGGLDHSKFLGICSPAYTVLRNKIPVEPQFYKFYFKKESFITRLSQTVVGIRDGKQITFDNFGQIKIPYPSVQEQKKIAAFLNTIDRNLETLDSQIQGLRTWKKGLLQQMFV